MSTDHQDLGPLPKSDRQDELEQQSEAALSVALPVERFRLRSEPGRDRGTDRHIEIKQAGHDTNCRAQVQLKATDSWKPNQDGSVSLSVSTSNFNYLLNNPSSLYIYWNAKSKEFRYVWVRDERQRLEDHHPDWQSERSVTLRFRDKLDGEALDDIHLRVLRQAIFDRRLNEYLARRTEFEQVTVNICPRTLEIQDPSDIFRLLLANGMTIVVSGYASQCLDLIERIDPADRSHPRILLVRAYALSVIDRHLLAHGYLSEAALQRDTLTEDDRAFLDSLRDICSYRTGRISHEEYLQREESWADSTSGSTAVSHRLETARFSHLRERDPEQRVQKLSQLRAITQQLLDDPDAPSSLKLNARIIELYAQGQDVVLDFSRAIGLLAMRANMAIPSPTPNPAADQLKRVTRSWTDLRAAMRAAVDDAIDQKHPLLLADAHFMRALIITTCLVQPYADRLLSGRLSQNVGELCLAAMADADSARQLYQIAGCLEAELRSSLLLADLYELNHQLPAAQELARGVLPKAEAMEYMAIQAHANDLISGKTRLASLMAKLSRADSEDEDYDLANVDDATIASMARDTGAAAGLPVNRTHVLARYWESRRSIAKERVDWCRHIELWQNLSHEADGASMYSQEPPQICVCLRFHHRSQSESTHWDDLIGAFKCDYCNACQSREPKQPGGDPPR